MLALDAMQLEPELALAYTTRGLALLLKGKDVEANGDFQRSLTLRPDLKADLERRINLARELRGPKD